ncbi:MAG: hypothetical protein AAGD04_06135 [Pseudomonadota bacterium]
MTKVLFVAILSLTFLTTAPAKASGVSAFQQVCQIPQLDEVVADTSGLSRLSALQVAHLQQVTDGSFHGWQTFRIPNELDVFLTRDPNSSVCMVFWTETSLTRAYEIWEKIKSGPKFRASRDFHVRGEEDRLRGGVFMVALVREDIFVQSTFGVVGSKEQFMVTLIAVTLQASIAACELYPERCI